MLQSEIFCTGPILQQVQNAKLFDDDKYFVDMKLRAAPDVVSLAFHNLSKEFPNATVPPDRLKGFLSAYFEEPGTEFESWTPPDWHEEPTFLGRIADQQLRDWAKKIHALWKSLGRKMRAGVQDHPELHSLIYAPHPVVVPGGRFREFYYWDSYWVVNGLLLSEMTDTARGMIQNFLHLVNRYGFIPNGGRIYYERRSQPPFLTLMVESYYHATKDKEFLRDALPTLEKEYSFWMRNRSVAVQANGVEHVLNRYHVQVESPRPESYTDDVELAEGLPDALKEQLWMDLHSGAESGWDFSSRWFLDNRTLRHTRTSQIVPSDLNALMCLNEKTLAFFHTVLGDGAASDRYDRAVTRRLAAMESVLWDPGSGAWFDYNLVTNAKNRDFYPSNLAPVWARCYSRPEMGDLAVKYLKGTHALDYHNGVPSSLFESGQQWDFPNAWPPLQHMLIDGLSKLPSEDANALAFTLAQRWIKTNWMAYVKYEAMFEKYDVNGDGKPGGGGEYEVQLGFGWTNGVALQLLNQYGDRLSSGGRSVTFDLLMPLVVSAALAFM
ncbi:trehalase isoform X2 [Betta splendens]|uniref:Trehalase n=1 Tax=Betta splendens TaxID=158456 RepID=A0A9W2Y765_BETSP|nr:trehalase isoform X2 [Betta splendens]